MNKEKIEVVLNENTDANRRIVERIKYYRKYILYMPRKEFSEFVGVTTSIIENMEFGRSNPTCDFMIKLANKSGRSVNSFIMSDEPYIISISDKELLSGVSDEAKIETLMFVESIKNNIIGMYDNEIIMEIIRNQSAKIGYLLRFQREKNKLSAEEMSDIICLQRKSLYNIETDNSKISFENLRRICEVLNIPMDYFFMSKLNNKDIVIRYLLKDILADLDNENKTLMKMYIQCRIKQHIQNEISQNKCISDSGNIMG